MIAALCVERGGIYWDRTGVIPYDKARNALLYWGPHPAVCHTECDRWGRYWSGGPSCKEKRQKGADGGQFAHCLGVVRTFGGIMEHPEASHAWAHFGLNRPPRSGGWVPADFFGGWTCCVEQGHYGHPARKATWLYAFGVELPELIWGPSEGRRLDEGFHSSAERQAARAAGRPPLKRLSRKENLSTPPAFAEILISTTETANRRREAA